MLSPNARASLGAVVAATGSAMASPEPRTISMPLKAIFFNASIAAVLFFTVRVLCILSASQMEP